MARTIVFVKVADFFWDAYKQGNNQGLYYGLHDSASALGANVCFCGNFPLRRVCAVLFQGALPVAFLRVICPVFRTTIQVRSRGNDEGCRTVSQRQHHLAEMLLHLPS